MEPLIILISVLVCAAVLAIMGAIRMGLSGDRHLDTRMNLYLGAGFDPNVLPEHVTDKDNGAIADRLNAAIDKVDYAESIRRNLARADVPLMVSEYVLLKIAATLLPTAIVLLVTRSFLAAPPIALLGFFAPSVWLRMRQQRRQYLFAEQMPEMLSTIVGSLRGGFSLAQSIGNVATETPAPMGVEMRRVMQELQLGLSLSDALGNLAKRMGSEDLDMLVTVLRIHTRIGGNLTVVLESINTTIRERTRLQREIRVITSHQRYASYVLGLLPVILMLILLSINPVYMLKLFQPGPFLVVPIGAVILNIAGFVVIQRIVDIKV